MRRTVRALAVEDDRPHDQPPHDRPDRPRGYPGSLPEGERDLALLGDRDRKPHPDEGVGRAPGGDRNDGGEDHRERHHAPPPRGSSPAWGTCRRLAGRRARNVRAPPAWGTG